MEKLKNKRVLTVTLNPAVDRFITIDGFKEGHTYDKPAERLYAGGKGVNVSRALNELNVSNLAAGILGGCSGKVTLLKLMAKEGINQDFYRFGGYSRSNVSIFNSLTSKTTRIIESGPCIGENEANGFIQKYEQKLHTSNFVVLSGRNANGLRDDFYHELIDRAHKFNVPAILDTSGKPFAIGLKAQPFLIKPNRQEVEELLNIKLNSQKNIIKAIKILKQFKIAFIFITLGDEGAFGFCDDQLWYAQPLSSGIYSEVGCGDAFVAGAIYGILRRQKMPLLLSTAAACANASTLVEAPGGFKFRNFKNLISKVKSKKLCI